MPKLNQKGAAHLLIPIILILGLIALVYLITSGNPLKLFSKASVSGPKVPEVSFTLRSVDYSPCEGIWCWLSGKAEPGGDLYVNLFARSDIEEANLFTARMKFPTDLVEVKELKTGGSFVTNWVEEYYDNETGEIALSGGVPDPGYKTEVGGESSLMATIVFRAKALGKGTVTFTDESEIFSNLNNINILTVKRPYDISIEVKPSPTPISGPIEPTPTPISCETGVTYYGYDNMCGGENSMSATYGCVDGYHGAINKNVCTPRSVFRAEADKECAKSIHCKPLPTATPVPTPGGPKGDGNKDGKINLTDLSIQHTDWKPSDSYKKTIRPGIDMNSDGYVNSIDFSALRGLLQQLGVIKVRK